MAFRGICIFFATADIICCNIVAEMLRGVTFETYLVDPLSIVDVSRFWKMSKIEGLSKAIYWTSQISPASSSSSTSNQQPASSVGPSDNSENNENVELDKKSRVVWNEELDRKFLNAIHTLLPNEKPVLNKIIEFMGVPGLKRKSISSHLQKYNLRVAKKSRDDSTKQMGFPSLSDGLNIGNYPIFWYPTSADTIPTIPRPAAIPEDETNSEQAQPVDVHEEANPAPAEDEEEKKEEDDEDGLSTIIANFWNDPPSLD